MSTLTIDIPDELLSKVDEYKTIYQKSSREQAIKELLNDVLSLPPYFDNWNWDKAEAEADEAIKRGEVVGPFDNIGDALKALKETKV